MNSEARWQAGSPGMTDLVPADLTVTRGRTRVQIASELLAAAIDELRAGDARTLVVGLDLLERRLAREHRRVDAFTWRRWAA